MPYAMFSSTPTERVISRNFALCIGQLDPQEIITELDPDQLTPWGLRGQLRNLAKPILDSCIDTALATDKHKDSQPDEKQLSSDQWHSSTTWQLHLRQFANSSIGDSMAAALSIPPMRRLRAMDIALSEQSKKAVRDFAAKERSPELPLPYRSNGERIMPHNSLRYDGSVGHIRSELPADENGCPVARGRGQLIQNLYEVIAEVTIQTVEWPAGPKVYPSSPTLAQRIGKFCTWL